MAERKRVPADLSKQPELQESPTFKAQRERNEAVSAMTQKTRDFILSKPVIDTSKSMYNYAVTIQNVWNRYLMTAFTMLEKAENDPVKLVWKMNTDTEWMKKAVEVFNSDDAKEYRYHTLDNFQHIGRFMYAAGKIGRDEMKAYAADPSSPVKLGAGIGFKFPDLLSRFRDLYDSPEAGRWVNAHGHLFVDLPFAVAFDFANPMWAAMGSARISAHFNYLREAATRARMQKTAELARQALIPGSGMPVPLDAAELVRTAPTVEDAVRFLHAGGYRAPGILDKLGIKYFRRADHANSAAGNEHVLKNATRLRAADKVTRESIEQSEKLQDFIKNATSQEIFDWTNLIQDEKNLSEMTAQIIAGHRPPVSQAAVEAAQEFMNVASGSRIIRGANWAKEPSLLLRAARVEKKLVESMRRIADGEDRKIVMAEYHAYVGRQVAGAPPTLEWYWMKVGDETVAGEAIPKWTARLKREHEWKEWITSGRGGTPRTVRQLQAEGKYIANYHKLEAEDKLRDAWGKSIKSLATSAGRDMTESSWLKMVKDLESEISTVTATAPDVHGGIANKARLLDGLEDLRKMARKAGASPELRKGFMGVLDASVRALDVFSVSVRQAKIFFPFTHYLENNAINNVGKNLLVRGTKDYTNMAPRFSVLGEELDFVNGLLPARDVASHTMSSINVAGREIHGLLDVPGLENYGKALNTLNSPIEYWTRNPIGWGVYRDTVQAAESAAKSAGKAVSAQTLDDIGRNAAVEVVGRTQFTPYHAPAITLMERVMPGSFWGFRAQDLEFAMRYAIEHPVAASSFMRSHDEIKNMSVRGDGMLNLPGSNWSVDPRDSLPLVNTIQLMQRTRAPELGDTLPDTAMRVARSMDSALTNMAAPPRHLTLPAEALAGRLEPNATDDGIRRRDAKAVSQMLGQTFPGIDKAVQAVTGQPMSLYVPGEVGQDIQRIHEEKVKRGGVLEQRVAWLRKQPIPDAASAERRFVDTEQNEAAMGVAGFRAKYDPDGMRTAVKQWTQFYYQQPGKAAREVEYNRLKIPGHNGTFENFAEGLVTRPEFIPQTNPDKKTLDDFGRAKPEERKQIYLDSTQEQRKGMLREFWDKSWEVIKSLRSDIRSNIGVGTAEAAESQHFDVPPDTFPNDKNVQRYVKALPRKQETGVDGIGSIFLDVGVPSKYGKSIIWTNHDLPNLTEADIEKLHEIDFKMNAGSNALLTMFQQGGTKEEMLAPFKMKDVPIVDSSGNPSSMPLHYFINPAKPITESRLYRTFQHAVDQGVRSSKSSDPDNDLVNYSARIKDVREAMSFLATGEVPGWKAAQFSEKQKIRDAELNPGLELLKKAAYHPKDWNPIQVDKQINESIASGAPGALPKDFWNRVKGAGEYALLADYGSSIIEARAMPIYSLLHRRDQQGKIVFNEHGAYEQIARGHEPELRALAQHSPELKSFMKSNGFAVDSTALHDDGLALIGEMRGYEWKDEDVDRSIGVVPRAMVPRTSLPNESPSLQFETRPMLQPQPTRQSRTPLQPQVDPKAMLSQSVRAFHSVSEYVRYSARDAMDTNNWISMKEKADGMAPGTYDRVSVFSSAINNLSMLPPTAAARGAAGIMQLGNQLGFVGRDDLSTIYRGINQADLVGNGAEAAETVLALAGNSVAALSSAEQYARLSKPMMTVGADGATVYGKTGAVANPNYNPAMAGLSKYGAAGGSLLSFGSGVARQADAPEELTIGLGAGGGALQGAAAGVSMGGGVWGAAIGAIIGGALGGFTASQNDDRDRYERDRALAEADIRQRMAFAAERQAEFRIDTDLRRTGDTRNALNRAFGERQSRTSPAAKRLTQFLRRPTYTSSQGLVRDVERNTAQTLKPRY